MQKFYQKHELWVALAWIIFYVVAVSFADELSRTIGTEKIMTLFAAGHVRGAAHLDETQ